MFRFFHKKKTATGFTFFEILIFLVIFSLLIFTSFIVAPAILAKARDSKRKADLERIKIALYDYFFTVGYFPSSLPACHATLEAEGETFLGNFPCAPRNTPYVYQKEEIDQPQWFKVLTNLENEKDQSIDKVGCRFGCGPECQYNYAVASSNILPSDGCIHYFACTPSGQCIEYQDPDLSRCPWSFANDNTCQNSCLDKKYRCHDERGKSIPD